MGPALEIAGANRQRNEQRDIMNRQFARTNATMDKTTGQVLGEGKKYTPESRMADMASNEQRVFDQSQKDLGAASAVPEANSGAQSADYLSAKAASGANEGNRLSALAHEIAKTRSPGELMNAEGLRRADLTGDVAHQWGVDQNMANAAQMDVQNVEEPWWGKVGKIADAIGMAMLTGGMSGFGKAGSTGAPTTGSFARMDRGQSYWM